MLFVVVVVVAPLLGGVLYVLHVNRRLEDDKRVANREIEFLRHLNKQAENRIYQLQGQVDLQKIRLDSRKS